MVGEAETLLVDEIQVLVIAAIGGVHGRVLRERLTHRETRAQTRVATVGVVVHAEAGLHARVRADLPAILDIYNEAVLKDQNSKYADEARRRIELIQARKVAQAASNK